MSQLNHDIWEAKQKALKEGFELVIPNADQLTLDLDGSEAISRFEAMLPMFKEYFPIVHIERWESKSGADHQHVLITLVHTLTPVEAIAFQAILGSDPSREMFAMAFLHQHGENPSMLYRPKPVTK